MSAHTMDRHSLASATTSEGDRLEQALRRVRELEDFVGNCSIGLHWVGPDKTILWANQAELDLLGYRSEEYIGRDICEFHADQNVIADLLRRLERDERPRNHPARMKCKDGSLVDVLIDTSVYRENGKFIHTRCFTRDVTTQRRTEQELAKSESLFRSLANLSQIGIYRTDASGKGVYVNDSGCRILGALRAEVLGDGWASFLHPADRPAVMDGWAQAVAAHKPFAREFRFLRPDKQALWVFSQSQPEFGPHGEIVGHVGTFVDINERKNAEIQAQDLAQRLKLATEAGGIGVWDYLIAEDELHWDERMFQIYRIDKNLFPRPKRAWVQALHPEDRPRVLQQARDAIAGVGELDAHFRICWPDGEIRTIESHASVQRDESGVAVRVTGVNWDVTARVRMEARMLQTQKMESLGCLAGGVAHDFNNLLTVINGYSRLLLGKSHASDPFRGNLETILKAGEQAAALTRQLLAFSRQQKLEPALLDLNAVVAGLQPILARLLPENIELQFQLDTNTPLILADRSQMEQALMNLAVNARDAMHRGGILLIETGSVVRSGTEIQSHPNAHPGRFVQLKVSDTGVGMDEQTKPRIFDPFFTTKGVGKGTGLGLSMVLGVVEQSGGFVEVDSAPGRGSAFKIYLPPQQAVASESKRTVIESPTAPSAVGGITLLVVEDQDMVREYLAVSLASLGYHVITANSGADAIPIWREKHAAIDMVVTDVVMPGMDGRELVGHLRKIQPDAKFLFMSGYTDDVISSAELSRVGVELISKPFNSEQLAEKIRELLR